MSIARKFLIGGCALSLLAGGAAAASKSKARVKAPTNCAMPAELAAMQVSAIQQELMDAALTCGDQARNDFNAFQTGYSEPLRKSDKQLLAMFRRLQGRKGDAAYNLFKTDLASRAEFRRIQHAPNFCAAASQKAHAALDGGTASLQEFAANAAVVDFVWPVSACALLTAAVPVGPVGAIPDVLPLPNPLRVAELTPPPAAAVPPPVEAVPAVQPQDKPKDEETEKKSTNWFGF
jgi:hypothetical protein